MQPTLVTCKNCGNPFTGRYCNKCGEKVYTERDKSVKHILEEALHFITHFDGTFFTTIRSIFSRPGKLSLDYCEGKRKKYFKPVSLFLICVVLYLLFPFFKGLNMNLTTYTSGQYNYHWFARDLAINKMRSEHLSDIQMITKYDAESPKISKILLLVFLPLTAALFSLLFYKRERKFFDHFILATEFNTFMIAFNFLLMPLMVLIIALVAGLFGIKHLNIPDDIMGLVAVISLFWFLISSFHRFYRGKRWLNFFKALLAVLLYAFAVMYIYKIILFLVVLIFI